MVKFKSLNIKPVKNKGTYVFGDFSVGLYYLDTPRFLGEQLASLALVGGQNIIAEKGALVPQYGYKVLANTNERVVAISKDSASASNFFIITMGENQLANSVYLYTANQGLKKYKTTLGSVSDLTLAHDGKNLIIYNDGATYLFGSYYSEGQSQTDIDVDIPYRNYTTYYEFDVPTSSTQYYWNGKEIVVTNDNNDYHMTVISVVEGETKTIVQAVIEGEQQSFAGLTASISENTIIPVDLKYVSEDYDVDTTEAYVIEGATAYTAGWLSATNGGAALTPEEGVNYRIYSEDEYEGKVYNWDGTSYVENTKLIKTINPALIESAQNRLFIVDIDGRIYYSAIGGVDMLAGGVNAFNQSDDAGFFEGFYHDSSKVLSIEDYMDGVLVCRENGIYYLTLEYPQYNIINTGSSGEGILSLSNMQVNIKKIANIGQQYAGDHVIVQENVIAYDSNSGTIVNAASVNVFGSIVAGDTIIDATTLNSYPSGLTSTKRKLTYNGQENVFILYYGASLENGVVLTLSSTLFPRRLDLPIKDFIGFNQGVVGVGINGEVVQDFKVGTIIEDIPAYADFEPIGVRDNRAITSSILEVTELNGVDYIVTTKNTGTSVQSIKPNLNIGTQGLMLPPLLYSDKEFDIFANSFELTSRWADKKASVTRIAAPMSGRDGVSISIEFPKNSSFCLAALRLPDFSQGEL